MILKKNQILQKIKAKLYRIKVLLEMNPEINLSIIKQIQIQIKNSKRPIKPQNNKKRENKLY